jgi:hypothetical protein
MRTKTQNSEQQEGQNSGARTEMSKPHAKVRAQENRYSGAFAQEDP